MTCGTGCRCSPCARRRRARQRRRIFGALELQCTGKYEHLVTQPDGSGTQASPCKGMVGVELYCNKEDVDAWNLTADDLYSKQRAAWNATVAVLNSKGLEMPEQVRAYVNQLERDYCDADENWDCVTYKLPRGGYVTIPQNRLDILTIIKWCKRAACALELLDLVRGMNPGDVVSTNRPVEPGPVPYEPPLPLPDIAKKAGDLVGDVTGGIASIGKYLALGGAALLAILVLTRR